MGEIFAAINAHDVEGPHTDEGDVVTVQWEMTGTFSGDPFHGVLATGRTLRLRGVDVMEFEGDLLRRNTIYYDGLLFARQVGLLTAEDSGTPPRHDDVVQRANEV